MLRIASIMALACGLLMGVAGAHAQGRGPSAKQLRQLAAVDAETARRAALAELDAWLRRLAGRFRSGRGRYEVVTDCVVIGTGPGVHCVRGGVLDEAPTMILYGLDPDLPGIRYLQVNGRSLAEGDVGKLSGDTVIFSSVQCPTSVDRRAVVFVPNCEQQIRIYAPPGGRYVLVQTHTMQRVYVPTPPNGKRPPNNPVTRLVEFTQNVQLQRIAQQAKPLD